MWGGGWLPFQVSKVKKADAYERAGLLESWRYTYASYA